LFLFCLLLFRVLSCPVFLYLSAKYLLYQQPAYTSFCLVCVLYISRLDSLTLCLPVCLTLCLHCKVTQSNIETHYFKIALKK
jgi:hypothetical protein